MNPVVPERPANGLEDVEVVLEGIEVVPFRQVGPAASERVVEDDALPRANEVGEGE
jgi:hypothetical protein